MPAIVSPSQPIRQSAHISDYPVAPAAGGSGCTSDAGTDDDQIEDFPLDVA
jgi:hypothetical protein